MMLALIDEGIGGHQVGIRFPLPPPPPNPLNPKPTYPPTLQVHDVVIDP